MGGMPLGTSQADLQRVGGPGYFGYSNADMITDQALRILLNVPSLREDQKVVPPQEIQNPDMNTVIRLLMQGQPIPTASPGYTLSVARI